MARFSFYAYYGMVAQERTLGRIMFRDVQWLTWPNAITVSRIVGVPLLLWFLVGRVSLSIIMTLYIGLVVTDFLDGWVARRTGTTSNVGEFMDQFADKVFVLPLLWYLFQKGEIAAGPLYFIVPREVLVVAFRIIGIFMGIRTPSLMLGKVKASAEYLAIGLLLAGYSQLGGAMLWVVVVLAIVSFFQYAYHWGLLMLLPKKVIP